MDLRATHYGGEVRTPAVVLAKKKSTWQVSAAGKIYVALVLIETLSLIGLCIASLQYATEHADEEVDSNSVLYTAICAMIAAIAVLFFALDSIVLENVFQFYTANAMHALISAYVIWHYTGEGGDLGIVYSRIRLWVMVAVCVFQAAYIALAYPVQTAFGWRLYKKIGGSMALRPLYRDATIFFSLLKLDFALGLILVLLAIFYLLTDPGQIAMNACAVFVTLLWLILGFAFVQRESRRLAVLFFAFAPLEPAYVLYKLIMMRINNNDGSEQLNQREYPVFSWTEFLMTGCVAVVVRLACTVYGIICLRNFGKGLRAKMWAADPRHTQVHSPQHAQVAEHGYAHGHAPPVVVVESEPQDRSLIRNYLQPLL